MSSVLKLKAKVKYYTLKELLNMGLKNILLGVEEIDKQEFYLLNRFDKENCVVEVMFPFTGAELNDLLTRSDAQDVIDALRGDNDNNILCLLNVMHDGQTFKEYHKCSYKSFTSFVQQANEAIYNKSKTSGYYSE